MKSFIENVSLANIEKAWHYDPGARAVLIQIVDPDMEFPKPKYEFELICRFKFLDIEEDHEMACQENQAAEIAKVLKFALETNRNVIVHCHAGVCRSGAVAQVGIDMGFQDVDSFRIPNLRVKKLLQKEIFG